MWQRSWNDQQNHHVSLRPLQEETPGGGLRGSQSSLWTGKLFHNSVVSVVFVLNVFNYCLSLFLTCRCGTTEAWWIARFK